MKNTFYKIGCTVLLAAIAVLPLSAQTFEGVIKYTISYENLPAEMEEYKSMLPSEAISTIKGHMFKMEQPLSMGMKQVTIMDNEAESGVLLMDMMGKKSAIVLDKESREKFEEDQADPEFEYFSETKKIAGYDCKKAIMTMSNGEDTVELEVYYTEDIAGSGINQMRGLKGFPLQYSTAMGQFIMTLTAESVDEKKVSDEAFTIPEGYEHITFEDFQKSMGQSMGQ